MLPLSYNFKVLQVCGLWKTEEWSQGWRSWLYSFYTIVVCFFVFGMTGLGLLETFLSWDDVEVAIDNLFVMLSITAVCAKMMTFLVYKKEIVKLFQILDTDNCRVRNNSEEEKSINENFNRLIRFRTKIFSAMAQITIALLILNFFITFAPRHELPYKIWLPGNLTTSINYQYLLFYEIIANTLATYVNITYDTIVPSVMLLACEQFSLLKYRARFIGKSHFEEQSKHQDCFEKNKMKKSLIEKKMFTYCIEHQLVILKFIDAIQNIFEYTICFQYFISVVALCLSVYKIAHVKLISPLFITLIVYISALLVQIFMLCIAATEIAFYSYEFCCGLYEVDWYTLTSSNKVNILIMMAQATKPIKFTCLKFINVSLDSFFHLLKLSYSVYNVLKKSSI